MDLKQIQDNKFLVTEIYEAISLDYQITVFNFFFSSMCHHEHLIKLT